MITGFSVIATTSLGRTPPRFTSNYIFPGAGLGAVIDEVTLWPLPNSQLAVMARPVGLDIAGKRALPRRFAKFNRLALANIPLHARDQEPLPAAQRAAAHSIGAL